jgi:hypothetical protein
MWGFFVDMISHLKLNISREEIWQLFANVQPILIYATEIFMIKNGST